MNVKQPVKPLAILCTTLFILASCQKENSGATEETQIEQTNQRVSGLLPDDPGLVSKVPLVMSAEYAVGAAARSPRGKDSDKDGIPDISDACPAQKETINGYQDSDGCPDTIPSPGIIDSDGDGIADGSDACPTQKETINGYQDSDGCPDTIPDSDGDGINDLADACPSQAENFNGFEDTDGCPDTAPVVLPPSTTLPASTRLAMPPVGYQGSEGTCAPFAAVYAARSSEQYHRTNATSYSYGSNIFSPEYVYNQTKAGSGCASGSSMVETLNFMVNNGVCTWQSMPYSDLNGCSQTPTAAQQAEAANYKIPYFSRLYTTDKVGIKTMLSQKHSLVVSFTFDQNFSSAGPGYIWKSLAAPYYGPHAVVLCGYDDSKNAYLAMNSWGNSWGDNGYIWIDYNFLSTISYDLYTMNY